ncbi:sugar transferase [Altibacter sp.]|uniref:sugar transferase n=1 Tax=Altibacter sp. TaxID=2024823 RepID=UPI000C8BE52F|nr:sugar transferase [Altibacter sp.]MAP55565.1 lipid carrier--UDP-N-acetylgalactosaminyltransferase [Altibacter sp.]
MYKNLVKVILDWVVALALFLVLTPVFLLLTVLLAFVNAGSPFFLQKRPGLHERLFTIVKFKTMNDKMDSNGQLLPDEKRITAIGKIVRKTSLDEIPQLINVIKGDMSLVGPRPLLPQYIPLYNDFQRLRHNVKPGITGYAQVNGRNAIGWHDKFKLDVYYVQNQSFALDLKILFQTLFKVMASEGISDGRTQTVTYFTGNDNKE